jgi:hypothetical protein
MFYFFYVAQVDGFAKLVDASATMRANLALAGKKTNWLPLSSNSAVQF